MADGLRAAGLGPIDELPLSDGGDGLLDAVAHVVPGARRMEARVTGPLGEEVRANYLVGGTTAYVESAGTCGLALVPPAGRDPMRATTRGLGELIGAIHADALVLGLGGSATVEGGAGMAQALGWRLLDGGGEPIGPGGAGLLSLRRVAPPERAPGDAGVGGGAGRDVAAAAEIPRVTALADVRNPLLGEHGAARVFGPQKGADADDVGRLEEGLERLAERVRSDLGVDVARIEGGGAAGGLGAGAVAFLGARLVGGSAWMLEATGFDARLARARLVVTGEGAYDGQSGMGKIVGAVVDRAGAAGVPVVVIAGRTSAPARQGVRVLTSGGSPLDATGLARLAVAGAASAGGREA